ncbi:hypothetical protein [Nocardia sp. CA-290969]|uniref:hypothetical protein n=1 Tax=Nocardia sp. CA-290969 TaxID=3239986 RepID=UPI003D8FDF45
MPTAEAVEADHDEQAIGLGRALGAATPRTFGSRSFTTVVFPQPEGLITQTNYAPGSFARARRGLT